jgi:hypothetical protein
MAIIIVTQFKVQSQGHGRYLVTVTTDDGHARQELVNSNDRALARYLNSDEDSEAWLEGREDLTRSALCDYNATIEFK